MQRIRVIFIFSAIVGMILFSQLKLNAQDSGKHKKRISSSGKETINQVKSAAKKSGGGNTTQSACGTMNITPVLQCAGNNIYNFKLICQNAADPSTDSACIMVINSVAAVQSGAVVIVTSALPLSIHPGQTGTILGQIGPILQSGILNFSIGATGPNGPVPIIQAFTLPPPPAAPLAGSGSLIQPTQFTAAWSWVIGAVSFKLDLSTNSGFTSYVNGYHDVTIGTLNAFFVTGLITGLSCNTTYYYRVRAVGACGITSVNSNTRMVTTALMPAPAAPIANAAAGIQPTQFTASWTPVAGATSYYLYVDINPGFPSYYNLSMGTATSFIVTGTTSCTKYYYRVRAYGFCSGAGAYSNTVTVQTSSPAPHGSWLQGPGHHPFTIGVFGTAADINGCPGQTIPITMEVWGGGGGGGCGTWGGLDSQEGFGGGGGGGGGYSRTIINAVVPLSGTVTYYVTVGSGGEAGTGIHLNGGDGGFTQVLLSGVVLFKATGGRGGLDSATIPHKGGLAGSGTINMNSWSGTNGYNGRIPNSCIGAAGGLGGAGGGPGRTGPGYYNDGGDGGHGGYYHNLIFPQCTAQSQDNGLTVGAAGGNGRAVFTW